MSESSVDTVAAQVIQMRDMFRRTGVLYEVQMKNLTIWPYLAFPGVAKVEGGVDIKKRRVLYELKLEKRKKLPSHMKARAQGLLESIHFLLGRDFELKVKHRGAVIFHGKRLEPVKRYEGTDFEAGKVVKPWNFQKT